MPAYHITGPSGSGKSTVGRVLQTRGFRVIETDTQPGLAGWAHRQTRQTATMPAQPLPEDWVAAHGWYWDAKTFHDLLAEIGNPPVFFVGGAHNEKDFYPLFSKRFGLFVDNDTLVKRLQPREPQRWVDGSAELQNVLEWNAKSKAFNEANGAVSIDGTEDPEVIADTILATIKKKSA